MVRGLITAALSVRNIATLVIKSSVNIVILIIKSGINAVAIVV